MAALAAAVAQAPVVYPERSDDLLVALVLISMLPLPSDWPADTCLLVFVQF